MSCWVWHWILQHLICYNDAICNVFFSIRLFVCLFLHAKALIGLLELLCLLNLPPYQLMSWRISIWPLRDLWPRFNELLQIDRRMTWEQTRGRLVPLCDSLNLRSKWKPYELILPWKPCVAWPLPSRHIRWWRNTPNKKPQSLEPNPNETLLVI